MTRTLMGALAGITATTAMTAAMVMLHRRLSPSEQYPLPPRELTQSILEPSAAGGREQAEEAWRGSTLVAHYGYGAASGAIFGAVRGPESGAIGPGVAYGLAVWAVSYLGWIPVLRLLRPAHRHPPARNAVMLLAHAVWGASLALSLRQLLAFEASIAGGPQKDRPHHAGRDAP